MYSVNVDTRGVLSAVVIGNTLTLTEINTGSTNVIITASDGVLQVMDTFLVTIKNNPPRVANPLTDLTLNSGFGTRDVDISNTFEDEQLLMYSVNVATGGVLSAVVIGNTLTLTEINTGSTNVIITASDGVLQVMDTFLVTVKENTPPRIANSLADLTLNRGFGTHDLDISNTFEDAQPLMFSFDVDPMGVLTAELNGKSTLTLTEAGAGTTRIIITASDGLLETMDTFLVTVKENTPPRIANSLADLTLNRGFGTRDVDISNTFEDEQPLRYSVDVGTGGVLSAAISGNTLTLTEKDTGSTNVIVTASDGVLETMDTFLVTIKNNPPRIANSLADLTLNRGFGTRDVDISNTFEDEQPLTYSVNVGTGGVLSAVVSGNTLTLTEIDTGSTNVIITASDGVLEVMDTFLVTIDNIAPRIANPLADLTLREDFGTRNLDLSNTFEDEQPLRYSVDVGTGGVLSAAISGNTLTLTEINTGSTNVIITASDGVLEVMDTFLVTVTNAPPRVANPLADISLNQGFMAHDLAISNIFEDEQPLIISVNVAAGGVLSAAISGNTLTLTEIDTGATHVIITASDGVLEVMDTFLVTIRNIAPRVVNALTDLILGDGLGTYDLDISNTFKDERSLTFSVRVDSVEVLSAAISGYTLTLTEVDTGTTNVIVTASDGVLQVMDTFLVTIRNIAPRVANPLPNLTLDNGFGTYDLNISNTFKDERPLMFSIRVAAGGVLSAVISGETLTLTEVDTGTTNIIVTASDGVLQVMNTFLVTIINIAPKVTNPLPDLILDNNFGTHTLDISRTFKDKQPLMYSVSGGTPVGVVTTAISGDALTLTEINAGSTHIVVTASDGALQIMDTFLVTVKENAPPRVVNPLADLILVDGFGTYDLDISNTFKDERSLMFSVRVDSAEVLSAVVSGNTLTLTQIDAGSTHVIVTANDGMFQTMDTFLVTVNGVLDIITTVEGEKKLVKLYPNPTTGKVSLDLGSVGKALMKVYTPQGNIILEKTLSENTYDLELPGVAGLYLVEIITPDNRQIIKLVRE